MISEHEAVLAQKEHYQCNLEKVRWSWICVFVDLEKPYHRVPREEVWYWMKKSKVSEKYASVVEGIDKDSGEL